MIAIDFRQLHDLFKRGGEDCRASTVVEFAILAPVFLLMVFGMMAYALYFGASHSVQQLAADAARVSVAGINEGERNALVRDYLEQHAGDYMLVDASKLQVEIGDKANDPDQYQVIIRYDASSLPIWNLYPLLPLPDPVITFASSIRRGGI